MEYSTNFQFPKLTMEGHLEAKYRQRSPQLDGPGIVTLAIGGSFSNNVDRFDRPHGAEAWVGTDGNVDPLQRTRGSQAKEGRKLSPVLEQADPEECGDHHLTPHQKRGVRTLPSDVLGLSPGQAMPGPMSQGQGRMESPKIWGSNYRCHRSLSSGCCDKTPHRGGGRRGGGCALKQQKFISHCF